MSKIGFDEFTFDSKDENSRTFQMKRKLGEFVVPVHEIFEAQTCISIVSLLTDKSITFSKYAIQDSEIIFDLTINDGIFTDLIGVKPQLEKFLHIDSSLFKPYIRSGERFYESVISDKQDPSKYSMAFALLVYSIESLANVVYRNKSWRKRERFVRFVENNVDSNRFLSTEIRQLKFTGKQKNTDLVFRELLNQSYLFRNAYVHHGEILPTLSRMADALSMAFISNDQIAVFPSHSWLRRITRLALINFLNKEQRMGRNYFSTYFEPYKKMKFKPKRAIQKGEGLDENAIYLQWLTDDFFNNRRRF